MNKKIKNLKNRSLVNIILFFIEFFILSSVYKSSLNSGNLFNWLNGIFPLLSKDVLLLSSTLLLLFASSIRYLYAKYLNNLIEETEKKIDIMGEVKVKMNNKENEKIDFNEKELIKDNNYYPKIEDDYDIFLNFNEEMKEEKEWVKVYKR